MNLKNLNGLVGCVAMVDFENIPAHERQKALTEIGVTPELPYVVIAKVEERFLMSYGVVVTSEESGDVLVDGKHLISCDLAGINDVQLNEQIRELGLTEFVSRADVAPKTGVEPLPAKMYKTAEYLMDNEKSKHVKKELATLYNEIKLGYVPEDVMVGRIAAYITNLANKLLS